MAAIDMMNSCSPLSSSRIAAGKAKVQALINAIKQVQQNKKYLQLNSVQVKSNIHSSVSRLLELMRSREVWLLNQTDVVFQAKEDMLRSQEDCLNRALGSLTSCLRMFEGSSAVAEEDLIKQLESIELLETLPQETPYISFSAESIAMKESIHKFGRIDNKGVHVHSMFGSGSEVDGSTSLPKQFEEYEDEEYQVLHKPVADGSDSTEIVFRTPSMESKKWLTSSMRQQSAELVNTGPKSVSSLRGSRSAGVLDKYLRKEGDPRGDSSFASIHQWLSDVNLNDEEEEMQLDAEFGFLPVGMSQHEKSATYPSASIQKSDWLPVLQSRGSFTDWLSKSSAVIGHYKRDNSAESGPFSSKVFSKITDSPSSDWIHIEGKTSPVDPDLKSRITRSCSIQTNNEQCWLSSTDVKQDNSGKVCSGAFQSVVDDMNGMNKHEASFWLLPSQFGGGSRRVPAGQHDDEGNQFDGFMQRLRSYSHLHWLKKNSRKMGNESEESQAAGRDSAKSASQGDERVSFSFQLPTNSFFAAASDKPGSTSVFDTALPSNVLAVQDHMLTIAKSPTATWLAKDAAASTTQKEINFVKSEAKCDSYYQCQQFFEKFAQPHSDWLAATGDFQPVIS